MNVPKPRKFSSIADALQAHYGVGRQAARRIARDMPRDVRPSERTAHNWLTGLNVPRGDALVYLMGACDPLFEHVLARAGRSERYDGIKRDEAIRDFLGKIGA